MQGENFLVGVNIVGLHKDRAQKLQKSQSVAKGTPTEILQLENNVNSNIRV